MKELIKNWSERMNARRERLNKENIKWEATHRYNIVLDNDECYLIMDGERISSAYNDYGEACKELFLLRQKYEESRQ